MQAMYPAHTRPTSRETSVAKLVPGLVRLMSVASGVGTGVGPAGSDGVTTVTLVEFTGTGVGFGPYTLE